MFFEERRLCRQQLLEGDSQHLAALAEDRLDDTLEQLFITAQVGHFVARHADDGTLHLWRRIEDAGLDGKEILHIVPRLDEDRKDAVLLVAGLGSHADGHLMLYHTRTAGYQVLVVEHLEENLRRDVIRIITRQHKRLTAEDLGKVHTEEVAGDNRPVIPRFVF